MIPVSQICCPQLSPISNVSVLRCLIQSHLITMEANASFSSVSILFQEKKKGGGNIFVHKSRGADFPSVTLNQQMYTCTPTHSHTTFFGWARAFLEFVDLNHCWQKIMILQVKNSLARKTCDCQSTLVLQRAKKSSWESLLPPLLSGSIWSHYGLESQPSSSADLTIMQLGFQVLKLLSYFTEYSPGDPGLLQ